MLDSLSAVEDKGQEEKSKLSNHLLKQIVAYCRQHRISPRYMTKLAVNNSEIVPRLKAGGSVTIKTHKRLMDYMEQNNVD